MRVLLVVTDLDLGGAEAQVVALAGGLAQRGHRVRVVSMIDPAARTEQLDAAGVPWVSLGMRRGSADPRGLLRLRHQVTDFRPDVVHAHMVHANLLTRLTRLLVHMPRLITTAHNTVEGGRLLDLGYRLTDRLTDLTTNVSDVSVQAFRQRGLVPSGRIITVPNGLDFAPFEGARSRREQLREQLGLGGFTWLAVGRLAPEKDFLNLFRAFRQLPPDAELLLVGDGPQQPVLQAELPERARLLGRRNDVAELMAAADGFVLSSRVEGLPMVLLEAGAAGLPLVSTIAGGTQEIVQDFDNGRLVAAADSEALARAMLWVMELPVTRRAELAEAGRRSVRERYGLPGVLDRWEELYAG